MAGVKGIAESYRVPLAAIQRVEDGHVRGAEGLLEKAGSSTCVTAIKKHDLRDTLEIRLYNLTGNAIKE